MAETAYNFKCLGDIKRDDGTIDHYIIEVTDARDGRAEVLQVKAGQLLSAQSMKTTLLKRRMFYTVKQRKHDEMLLKMFDPQPESN
ncbi:hypothetical protein [Pseudomonas chlororaphis]|uniref:hypothetical protein n=1 Tax=Pseudomonas chlororaphis TaxID=587753 RepID=UPI0039E66A8F